MIDATSGNARATPTPSTASRQQQHQRQLQKKQQADMVTTADFAVFQQQLRQEMTDVIQQLRTEMNETVNGRMDMLNSINTALQNVSTKTTDFKPYRISDFIQEIGKAATKKENSEASCQTCTYGCKHGQTRVSESWRELRALTRLIAQHWPWIAWKQTSEPSKPLCTRSCTGRQQMNH